MVLVDRSTLLWRTGRLEAAQASAEALVWAARRDGLRGLGDLPALADLANPDDERIGDLQLTMLPEAD